MPGRNKVKTTYQQAGRTPGKRIKPRTAASTTATPKGLSPLTRYIEENAASGLSVRELIEQFQEYDCPHPEKEQRVVAEGSTYKFLHCENCGRTVKKMKPGEKADG